MLWNQLPPQSPEECPFRATGEQDLIGEVATCSLLSEALRSGSECSYEVSRQTCLACCRKDPPTSSSWNSVVSSLIYQKACTLLKNPDAQPEAVAKAMAARDRALQGLDATGPGLATKQLENGAPHGDLRDLIPLPSTRNLLPIRKWAVGVTTSPRTRSTIEACLSNLKRAGWESPHLFMDSVVRVSESFGHLPGTLRSPASGAWPNHYLALLELTMRQPDADAFLVMQDDALIYAGENVKNYLEQTLWPGQHAPIVSLFCPEPYTAATCGWHRFRKHWIWGAQAFVFPREIALAYLSDRSICQHRWRSINGGLSQIDVLIGWWTRRRRIPIWYPTPSLVQHIGETSTIWPNCPLAGPRVASDYVGNRS
jgi:hypothetical protein